MNASYVHLISFSIKRIVKIIYLKYNIYSKEIYLNNQKLLDIIPTYDALLLNVTSNESIKYILKQQLEKYKEVEKN